MPNQPQDMKAFKGQIAPNTGAAPPSLQSIVKATDPGKQPQNMKRIPHNAKMDKHNSGVKGQ